MRTGREEQREGGEEWLFEKGTFDVKRTSDVTAIAVFDYMDRFCLLFEQVIRRKILHVVKVITSGARSAEGSSSQYIRQI